MGKIPGAQIQEVLDKTNFLQIYQEKVRLTKKGGKWWGLCPFHGERTPSFSVDADRGLFYCFGCQKGGSVIDFLMEMDKLSFPEAIGELAGKANVTLVVDSSEAIRDDSEKSQLYALYDKLATMFNWLLTSHKAGSEALSILKKRGIPDSLIGDFKLGYSPADVSWLYRFLSSKGFSPAFLARSGLFSTRAKTYPLFSNRIMFPIADQRGRVIAFGGRLISGDGPKYINSPDTEIFRKQENLFAFDKALPAIKSEGRVLVCEGYMDALSFHTAGITSAVAPLGTAFTHNQARNIARRAQRVELCFDSDEAGQKAAERACSTAAEAGLEISVIMMGEGKDASEILEKSGPEALNKVRECSINSGEFLIRRAEGLFDLGTMEGKSKTALFFYPYLDALDSEVKRNAFLDMVGRKLGISAAALQADYMRAKAVGLGRGQGRVQSDLPPTRSSTVARTADLFFMTAVVLHPSSFPEVRKSVGPEDFDDVRARDLFLALEDAFSREEVDTTTVLSLMEESPAKRFVLAVAAAGELDGEIDNVIRDGIRSVRIRSLERARSRLIVEIAGISDDQNDSRLIDLLKKKMQLDAELARFKGEVDE